MMKILDPKTIARVITKTYSLPTVPPPAAIHKFAKLKEKNSKIMLCLILRI